MSILHSSGTTGNPKPVIQTHYTGSAGPRWRMTADSISPGERFLTSLPQSHVGAIAFTSYALLCGIQVIAMYDPRPEELLDAIGEYSPTSVMSFAHAYSDLASIDLPAGALDSVERWVSVGDAVHEPHIRRLLAHRSEGLALSTFYDRLGSTELGWALLLHTSTIESPPKGRCAGRSTGAAEVVVLRTDGSQAAPGELGLLGAKGPTITVGYWNDCDTTYRSKLGGYWLSGDVAYRDADGFFYQVDRAVDAIAARPGPGYSVLMEEVLLGAVPEICDCGVVGGVWGDETVAVALYARRQGPRPSACYGRPTKPSAPLATLNWRCSRSHEPTRTTRRASRARCSSASCVSATATWKPTSHMARTTVSPQHPRHVRRREPGDGQRTPRPPGRSRTRLTGSRPPNAFWRARAGSSRQWRTVGAAQAVAIGSRRSPPTLDSGRATCRARRPPDAYRSRPCTQADPSITRFREFACIGLPENAGWS